MRFTRAHLVEIDTRRCGSVDVDDANPDSGVNKEFVVSNFPALTHVSDAEVSPFLVLFRTRRTYHCCGNIGKTLALVLTESRSRGVVQRQRQH